MPLPAMTAPPPMASSGINAYVTIDGKITRSADNNGNGGKRFHTAL